MYRRSNQSRVSDNCRIFRLISFSAHRSTVSIRQRLYPDQESVATLIRHCADAHYVWNLGLEQRNLWVRERTAKINYFSQHRELTEARQSFDWLANGSSTIQQEALRDLDRAFQNWWKNPSHFGRPTWRRSGINEGFRVVSLNIKRINRKWGEVHIPKVGFVRFRLTRMWSEVEAARSARITLSRSGQWHVSFVTPPPSIQRHSTGAIVGIDMGIANSVTMSEGETLHMPALLSEQESHRKRHLQRRMSRQAMGSNRRSRTKHQVAVLAEREKSRRKDWIEKTTTDLVREFDVIAVEDLKIKNMISSTRGTVENPGTEVKAKSGSNRSTQSQAWGTFRTRLTDKATWANSPAEIIAVPAANTSRRCSVCGHTAKENRESQAVFLCRSCGHREHADVNAAKNILAAGLAVTGRGGTPHAKTTGSKHSDPVKRQLLVEAAT